MAARFGLGSGAGLAGLRGSLRPLDGEGPIVTIGSAEPGRSHLEPPTRSGRAQPTTIGPIEIRQTVILWQILPIGLALFVNSQIFGKVSGDQQQLADFAVSPPAAVAVHVACGIIRLGERKNVAMIEVVMSRRHVHISGLRPEGRG
jgi:hypothetical protein